MAREKERSFGAESPVGQYWLVHCDGFLVEGSRGRRWIVERVSADPGNGDMLHVRRDARYFKTASVIPVARVATVDPWNETIRLRRRQRRSTAAAAAPATGTAERKRGAVSASLAILAYRGRRAARAIVRAAGRGAIVFLSMIAACSDLVAELAGHARREAPGAGRKVGSATRRTTAAAGAYAVGAAQAARTQSKTLAARTQTKAQAARAKTVRPPAAPPDEEAPGNGARARPPARRGG
jgi:hypothetical protein